MICGAARKFHACPVSHLQTSHQAAPWVAKGRHKTGRGRSSFLKKRSKRLLIFQVFVPPGRSATTSSESRLPPQRASVALGWSKFAPGSGGRLAPQPNLCVPLACARASWGTVSFRQPEMWLRFRFSDPFEVMPGAMMLADGGRRKERVLF